MGSHSLKAIDLTRAQRKALVELGSDGSVTSQFNPTAMSGLYSLGLVEVEKDSHRVVLTELGRTTLAGLDNPRERASHLANNGRGGIAESPPETCCVVWIRSDGQRIVISHHRFRDGAERTLDLIHKIGSETRRIYIEPELPAVSSQPPGTR